MYFLKSFWPTHACTIPPAGVNLIDNDNSNKAIIFVLRLFADKQTGTLYNDLTRLFPFMSLKGNVCFLVMYHYDSNAILTLPISGFGDKVIFNAYT